LSAIAPNFGAFMATRTATGIDDASYPGAYSLVSDYFPPTRRGRILAALQLTAVIGGITATALATFARDTIGWRAVFYITGSLGLLWALVLFFGIRNPRDRLSRKWLTQSVATNNSAGAEQAAAQTHHDHPFHPTVYLRFLLAVNSGIFATKQARIPPERVPMVVGVCPRLLRVWLPAHRLGLPAPAGAWVVGDGDPDFVFTSALRAGWQLPCSLCCHIGCFSGD
jgi:MFS family permease